MRQSIGGTWITTLVIAFIFLFIAFLTLSINYSKAFRVKNEVLSIIEKGNGMTTESINLISNYLYNSAYSNKHKCEKGYYGVVINGINSHSKLEYLEDNSNKEYSFCLRKVKSVGPNFPDRAYYEVRLFFKFNLPVVGSINTFEVNGQTKDVTYPSDKGIKVSSRLE